MSSVKPSYSFVAHVVGLSLKRGEPYQQKPGIGKSCLCHRFTHPGYDDYVSSHPSLLALHEFESPVINNNHFLYWGSPVKKFPTTDPSKTVQVRVHVLEHTVFYQDVTCQPFNHITSPDNPEVYIRKITGAIESPGKLSYQSRDDVISPSDYKAQEYPSGISKLARGFVVVVDLSQSGAQLEKQLARADKILEYLSKHKRKNVIAAMKRDAMAVGSLEKVYELKKKYKTHVVEMSAKQNLNINECFRVLAHKLLKNAKLSSHVQTYPDAAHRSLSMKSSARKLFVSFIKKRITDPDTRLDVICDNLEYMECCMMIGKYETDQLFAEHLMKLYDQKVELFAGVKENPEMREEFLEDFVEQRSDLALYSTNLREWIVSHIGEIASTGQDDEDTEQDFSPTQLVVPPLIDDYQLFQRAAPVSPLLPHQVAAPENEAKDNDSYYSDSDGSEGPDYVNYDPKNLPMLGPEELSPSSSLTPTRPSQPSQPSRPSQSSQPSQPTLNIVPHMYPRPSSVAPPSSDVSPRTRPEASPSQSIKSRANILAGLLGNKSAKEQPVSQDFMTFKEPVMTPPFQTEATTTFSQSSRSNSSSPRRALSPPLAKAPKPLLKPKRTIQSRAAILQTQLGHNSPPPPTKPRPVKSVNPVKEGNGTVAPSKTQAVDKKTPPPVSKRVSSLQNSSESSGDSAQNTPTLKRRPSRVAPPPPIKSAQPPKVAPLSPIKSAQPAKVAMPPPTQTTPSSNPLPNKLFSPPPPSSQEEVSPTHRPKLEAIRKKINDRKSYEVKQLKQQSNEDTPKQQVTEQSKKRKDYAHHQLKSSSMDTPSSVNPFKGELEKHLLRKKAIPVDAPLDTNKLTSSHSVDVPSTTATPHVWQHLAQVNIDELCERENPSSPPPPSLPPRLMKPLEDEAAPTLPPRTKEMFIIKESLSVKGAKQNYNNIEISDNVGSNMNSPDRNNTPNKTGAKLNSKFWKKPKSSHSADCETSISPTRIVSPTRKLASPIHQQTPESAPSPATRELPPIPKTPRATFLNMGCRPLPETPFASGDDIHDEEHDYEVFNFDQQMHAQEVMSRQMSLESGMMHSVRTPAKEVWPLNRQPHQRVDVTQSLNITSLSLKKAKTFNGNDKNRPLVKPRPFPSGVWPEYVDGYVNTEPPPPGHQPPDTPTSVQGRQLPQTPFQQAAMKLPSGKTSTPDYDYPDIRTFFSTMPARGQRIKHLPSQIPIPPRFPPQENQEPASNNNDSDDDDDYIHMRDQFAKDDSYINSETIELIRTQLLDRGPLMSGNTLTHSFDDLYVNLPDRRNSLPPRNLGPRPLSKSPTVHPKPHRRPATSEATPSQTVAKHSVLPEFIEPSQIDTDNEIDYENASSVPGSFFCTGTETVTMPAISKAPVTRPTISLPPRNILRTNPNIPQ